RGATELSLTVRCVFFFSGRRRHTRSLRDWSSDVCSSDLTALDKRAEPVEQLGVARALLERREERLVRERERELREDVEVDADRQIGRASCRERGGVLEGAGSGREEVEREGCGCWGVRGRG